MKKIKIFSMILVSIFLVFLIIIKLSEKPEDILQKHLKNRYNKEFVIAYSGERSDGRSKWFEAEIYPKELVGTPKEKDKYYWAKGFVENGKGGDTYGKVLLNESANNFYLPKLKELFGENVLPVLDLKGGYIEEDYIKEMELRNKLYKERPDGNFNPLSGGIYIFGRVESDEDREWYRKQIYEFVQFMKETGTFEYVSLGIIVIDDRVLSKEFQENEELKTKLVENGEKYWGKDRRYYSEVIRRELMNKELPQKITPIISLEDINKSSMTNSLAWSNYNILLSFGLYSSKYVESMGWNRDSRPEVYTELKNYNTLSDIKFEDE